MSLARNTALDAIRRSRCRPATISDDGVLLSMASNDSSLVIHEIFDALELALEALSAKDRELIMLCDRELTVEQRFGSSVEHSRFRAEWVRVEPVADDGSLVELSGEGSSVRVGRHVRPELRVALAQELRRALRLSRAASEQVVDHELKT